MITSLDIKQYTSAKEIRTLLRSVLLSVEFERVARMVWEEDGDYDFEPLAEVYRSLKWNLQTFPCAEVDFQRSRNVDPSTGAIRLVPEINLFFHYRGDDEEQVEDRVNLWLKAARLFFTREYQYLEELGLGPIKLGDDAFSPFVSSTAYEGRPFIKSGMLVIELENIF